MIKKILVISPEFNEEFILYQPWRQIYELGRKLASKGIEFAIGTNTSNKDEIFGLRIIQLNQKKIRILSQDSKKQIIQFNPDVIIWMGNPLSGSYIKKNLIDNIPVVVYISTVHMLWKELKNFTIKEIFQSNLINFITAFSPFKNLVKNLNHSNIAGIIATSETVKDRLIKLGVNNSKIEVSPLCFDDAFKGKNKFTNLDSKESFSICYMGPLNSIRGTDLLIDMMEMFKKNNLSIHLNFLLRTSNPKYDGKLLYEKCKKKGILDLVMINEGILGKKELYEAISNSDLVVLPTKFVWNEPPLSILETMMLGKPVITSNVCGIPEIVKNRGFILNPDTDSFYNCVKDLVNKPSVIKQMSENGKEFVNSLPDWDTFCNWILDTLERFLQNSSNNKLSK